MNESAAVVADNYKLPIFRRNLNNAGFTWKEIPYDKNSTLLKVTYKTVDLTLLDNVIRESNSQAIKGKK